MVICWLIESRELETVAQIEVIWMGSQEVDTPSFAFCKGRGIAMVD